MITFWLMDGGTQPSHQPHFRTEHFSLSVMEPFGEIYPERVEGLLRNKIRSDDFSRPLCLARDYSRDYNRPQFLAVPFSGE